MRAVAKAVGHLPLIPSGGACNCGQDGCLEIYCHAAALLRYAGGSAGSAADVIAAANAGDASALAAIRTLAGYLARGCATVVQLLAPEAIILLGDLAMDDPALVRFLTDDLSA